MSGKTRKRKSMVSLINSNSPSLRGGLPRHSFFLLPLQYFLLLSLSSVLISLCTSLCTSPPISYFSLLFYPHFLSSFLSETRYSMLSALSSAPSHFLPFQPFSFLSSTYSILLLPYTECSLCVSSLSSIYSAIK